MNSNKIPFEKFPLDIWQKGLDVNLNGMFLCSQECGKQMKKQKSGNIINISSIYGLVGPDQRIYGKTKIVKSAMYSVTKSAVLNFTRYLAAYWSGTGIRVNTLSLGGVEENQDPTFKKNFIEDNNFKILKQEIEYHVGQFAKLHAVNLKQFSKNYDIVESWAAKFGPGEYAHIHNHGYADIAGVYYYKRPLSKQQREGNGNIFFTAPGPEYTSNPFYAKMARASWYFPEGTLVLFPGFLPHGVETNETDKDRISLSFNIKLRR